MLRDGKHTWPSKAGEPDEVPDKSTSPERTAHSTMNSNASFAAGAAPVRRRGARRTAPRTRSRDVRPTTNRSRAPPMPCARRRGRAACRSVIGPASHSASRKAFPSSPWTGSGPMSRSGGCRGRPCEMMSTEGVESSPPTAPDGDGMSSVRLVTGLRSAETGRTRWPSRSKRGPLPNRPRRCPPDLANTMRWLPTDR